MGTRTVHTTPQHAQMNLETTLAIVKAAETGRAVRLPLTA
jgi:hypothetical protein